MWSAGFKIFERPSSTNFTWSITAYFAAKVM